MFGFLKKLISEESPEQSEALIREKQISDIEFSLLKAEYEKEHDFIINTIKVYLKNQDYVTAQGYIQKYKDVARGDVIFCALADEVKTRMIEYNSQQRQQMELQKLKTLLEVTPENDHKKRYEICSDILRISPNDLDVKCELAISETALGLRPAVSSDLRIGRRFWYKEIMGFYEPKDPELRLPKGFVTVRLHTHGISINFSSFIYRIHYSQIISMEYGSEGETSKFLTLAAGAVLGYVFGDGLGGAIDGASKASKISKFVNSSDLLNILFWDVKTNSRNLIVIKCKDKWDIKKFIGDYNSEIEITKRTHRSPKNEENGLLKLFIIAGCVIAFLWLISVCISPSEQVRISEQHPQVSSSGSSVTQNVDVKNNEEPVKTDTKQSSQWVSSDSQCEIKKSGTTLSVKGENAANAVVEIYGISTDNGCGDISVVFDKKAPMNVNCSISNKKIKLSTDAAFIKKMRNSNSMTLTISNGDEDKTIKYSLMGFSKACDWTK